MNKINNKVTCVYGIVNKYNQRIYIGSATNFYTRVNAHRSYLNRNIHHSPHLQRAWNKYGEENFEFIVLSIVDKEHLAEAEQIFIDEFKSYDFNLGYNVLEKAYSRFGHKASDETKIKMSIARKGKFTGKDHHHYGKHNSDEQKEKTSKSLKEFYKNNINPNLGRKNKPETILKMIANFSVAPFLCNETQESFTSTQEASERLGISRKNIARCLSKQLDSASCYSFRFLDEEPRPKHERCKKFICNETQQIFESTGKAGKVLGIKQYRDIRKCLKGQIENINNYTFSYLYEYDKDNN